MTDKSIDLILRLKYESQGAEEAKKNAADLDKELERGRAEVDRQIAVYQKYGVQLEAVEKDLNFVRQSATRLQTVMVSMGAAGAAIMAPLLLDAKKFSDAVGYSDATSARWLASLQRIEYSSLRIGKTVEDVLNPELEAAAALSEKIAGFFEKNPQAVQLVVGAGSLLLGIATAGAVINKVIEAGAVIGGIAAKVAEVLVYLGPTAAAGEAAAGGATAAAGGAAAAGEAAAGGAAAAGAAGAGVIALPVAGVLAAVTAGVALAFGTNEVLANTDIGKQAGLAKFNQFATVGAEALGTIFGKVSGLDDKEIARKSDVFAAIIGKFTGAIDKNSPLWQRALSSLPDTSGDPGNLNIFVEKSRDSFAQFTKQKADAEKNSEEQRTAIVEQFGERRIAAEQNAEDQRLQVLKGLHKENDKAEADLNEQRAKTVRDGGAEIQKIEQDSQRRLVQMTRDHNNRLQDLTAARDALGIVKEDQRFNEQTDQERENTNTEIGRRRADLGLQLADMTAAFVKQRNARADDAKERLAEIKAQERKELDALTDQQAKALAKQRQGYDKQIQQITDAFTARINALDPSILQTTAKFQRMLEEQDTEYTAWIRAHSSVYGSTHAAGEPHAAPANPNQGMGNANGPRAIPRAGGGYAQHGIYELGEDGTEFVMKNTATRAAEQIMGARLNQENMVAGLLSARDAARGGGQGTRMNMNATITGRSLTYNEIRDVAIKEVLPAVLDHMNRGLEQ